MYIENPMTNWKEDEPKIVTYCCECNQGLTEQDEFLSVDGDHICDNDCLYAYYNITHVVGWEV